jgi:hypothetical protein
MGLAMPDKKSGLVGKISRYFLVIILLFAFAGLATYAVMSDSSIHGLTVRFYNVSWTCTSNSTNTNPILTFEFGSVIVYSSASLPTSLSHVTFTMSTNGVLVGTVTASDATFSPGQSASYTLAFSNPTLDPGSQPLSQQIALVTNAQVSAGLYSSQASASDSELVHFPGQAC